MTVGLPVLSVGSWLVLPVAIMAGVWLHISYFRRLRMLGLPALYIRAHENARFIAYSGWGVWVALVLISDWIGS